MNGFRLDGWTELSYKIDALLKVPAKEKIKNYILIECAAVNFDQTKLFPFREFKFWHQACNSN